MGSGQDPKCRHELEVFRAFLSASRLPAELDSVRCFDEEGRDGCPDIVCTIAGRDCYFELSEVLWEGSRPGNTLAKGLAESEKRARQKQSLVEQGRLDEAEAIRTWGSFGYPPLESLFCALERKRAKRYSVPRGPLSLLVYYERQDPFEPFDWIYDRFRERTLDILARSQFAEVWLFHFPMDYWLPLVAAEQMAEGCFRAPLTSFASPESRREVIGRLRVLGGQLFAVFDVRFAQEYHARVASLNRTPHTDRNGC